MKIYIVVGSWKSYSDGTKWIVKAFSSNHSAKEFANEMNIQSVNMKGDVYYNVEECDFIDE